MMRPEPLRIDEIPDKPNTCKSCVRYPHHFYVHLCSFLICIGVLNYSMTTQYWNASFCLFTVHVCSSIKTLKENYILVFFVITVVKTNNETKNKSVITPDWQWWQAENCDPRQAEFSQGCQNGAPVRAFPLTDRTVFSSWESYFFLRISTFPD